MSESFFKLIRLFTTSFQRRGQVINGKIAALCVIIKTRLKKGRANMLNRHLREKNE